MRSNVLTTLPLLLIHTTLLTCFYVFLTTYDYTSHSLFIHFLRCLNCVKELNCCGGEPNSSWTALPRVLEVLVMMLFPLHPLCPPIPARMLPPLSSRLSRHLRQSRAAYLHVQELLLCHLNPKNSSWTLTKTQATAYVQPSPNLGVLDKVNAHLQFHQERVYPRYWRRSSRLNWKSISWQ